jgi:hypothetical protein
MLAGFTHRPVVELSERLAALAPTGLGHAFYASDGASAAEIALKMSFHYWRNRGQAGKSGFRQYRRRLSRRDAWRVVGDRHRVVPRRVCPAAPAFGHRTQSLTAAAPVRRVLQRSARPSRWTSISGSTMRRRPR